MATEADHANRLAEASSPYLLQHADNPVDWYPWGEEAFRRAREEDRPVFLSIGYSTCHWCHVMAHESFEDREVARLLNEHYVSVKVDREERPDVDGVYMTACQMMTGRGGWPLTIVATPDREPFFAGTYFPKESRGGRPGLVQILTRIARLWEEDRERVLASARDATEALGRIGERRGGGEPLDASTLEEAYDQLERTFDDAHGGFGRAPKFPTPHNLLFLLRDWRRTGRERSLEMVTSTLRAMRRGGVYDQVGKGFHRYSTDARWLVPHFEKMLYDQALLATAYLEAHQATGDASFADTAREVFEYVLRDLRDPEGGFHSAEDADSEGGEGTFYVWTTEELEEVLDAGDAELARDVYGVEERGNFAEEATGERTGENILHLRRPLDELARERGMEPGELRERLGAIRAELYEAREGRPRPHLDDKVLADWNGLMVAALARGGFVLEEEAYLEAAREAAGFVLGEMRGEDGRLLHRWRRGDGAVPANAADYAFVTLGLIELYEATFEPRWLEEALGLADEMRERCWDEDDGGFFLAPEGTDDLPVRQKEVHDGALPSANSVALWNERRLARLTGQTGREETAETIERAFSEEVRKSPAAHAMFMVGLDFRVGRTREVVLAGRPGSADLGALVEVLREGYRPRVVALLRPVADAEDGASGIVELAPFARDHAEVEGQAAAYVCEDFTCRAPVTDPEALRESLDERGGAR